MSPDRGYSIRALIVDDEPLARSNLRVLLQQDPEIALIAECSSGLEGLERIRELDPDLVFLDVQMPECDGFDVLELLGGDAPPAIVFVTAYDHYALRAFDAGALDYLLKPFDKARFERTLSRSKERLKGIPAAPRLEHIMIKSSGRVLFVKISEIDWIEAADYYACLHVGSKAHLLRRSLADLEQDLDPSKFCRIHRSTIVNLERIRGLEANSEGEPDVVLENGKHLRFSRRYRKVLYEKMGMAER